MGAWRPILPLSRDSGVLEQTASAHAATGKLCSRAVPRESALVWGGADPAGRVEGAVTAFGGDFSTTGTSSHDLGLFALSYARSNSSPLAPARKAAHSA